MHIAEDVTIHCSLYILSWPVVGEPVFSFFEFYHAGIMRFFFWLQFFPQINPADWEAIFDDSITDLKIIMRGLRETPCETFWHMLCHPGSKGTMLRGTYAREQCCAQTFVTETLPHSGTSYQATCWWQICRGTCTKQNCRTYRCPNLSISNDFSMVSYGCRSNWFRIFLQVPFGFAMVASWSPTAS